MADTDQETDEGGGGGSTDKPAEQDNAETPADAADTGEKPEKPQDRGESRLQVDEKDTGKGLARTLTLTNCVTMIIGCIIGSGIFISPTGVQEVWCALGAYCYAELGTLITKSGGDYAYLMEAFGPLIAFLRLWIESVVVRPCALAIVSLTFALYTLRPIYVNCDPPYLSTELLAAAMISGPQYRDSFEDIFEGNFRKLSSPAVGFYSGLYAYQGWTYLNFITEELINPKRNLPLSVMISMGVVTVVYVLYNIALYVVVSPEEMLVSPATSVLFAEKAFGRFSFVMPIFVAISTVGSANGLIMTSSRLFFCGAREGHLPTVLAMINKRLRTPIPSVIFNCFIALLYMLMSGEVFVLINASQFTIWLANTVVVMALVWLRWKLPNANRPVKVS
ncbi:unnamed protein product [Nippostrongylus brasiliensis]|uniref:Cystine/glutamate transporter n=1 Tax=Nippostrongylus brasiliensis TaxID=27835 RepID=A0A158R0B6_NIPBR|nr:unnamed protein product [Nippostrongylus brasiliensis]